MYLKEFVLAEIDKDEAEGERRRRVLMLGLAKAWNEGFAAGQSGERVNVNPYAEV